MIDLKGMTWSHERGIRPMEAASRAFSKIHPEVRISWDARSLADFELYPLDQLASRYDLLMIDHPHIGAAVAQNLLLDLEDLLESDYLKDLEDNSVGLSYKSYHWDGKQWALPVDAAAQVCAYRRDLLKGRELPVSWEELLSLGNGAGFSMAVPFVPVHAYSSFFTLCSQFSSRPFWSDGTPLDRETGCQVLALLKDLLSLSHPDSYEMDPIAVLDRMSSAHSIAYVPLVYGYSNYAREGYGAHCVEFGNIPSATGSPEGSMIGGVGLAVSSRCRETSLAAEFLKMTGSAEFQTGEFFREGGQPGHRRAWISPELNGACRNFFINTLETLDAGSMRPRFEGYIAFQGEAGTRIRDFIRDGRGNPVRFVDELNTLFGNSRKGSGQEDSYGRSY